MTLFSEAGRPIHTGLPSRTGGGNAGIPSNERRGLTLPKWVTHRPPVSGKNEPPARRARPWQTLTHDAPHTFNQVRLQDRLARPFTDDVSALHHQHPISVALRKIEVVQHHHHAHSVG